MLQDLIEKIETKGISELDGKEFQELMNNCRDSSNRVLNKLYKDIIDMYFDEYISKKEPILESWNNDFDEVWDAEAAINESKLLQVLKTL